MIEDSIYIPVIHMWFWSLDGNNKWTKHWLAEPQSSCTACLLAGLQSAYGHVLENPSSASWAKQIFKIHFTNCVHWSIWFQFVGTDFETHTLVIIKVYLYIKVWISIKIIYNYHQCIWISYGQKRVIPCLQFSYLRTCLWWRSILRFAGTSDAGAANAKCVIKQNGWIHDTLAN